MRRPPKPRITKPHLVWRWNKDRSVWAPYHRVTWTEGGKQRERNILLKWEGDAQKLDDLYWECQRGDHDAQKAPAKYTWRELIVLWRTDPRVQRKLSDSTKTSYRRDMDRIMEKNAGKDMRRTTRQQIRAAHEAMADTPRKADKFLQVVSLLWNYAVQKEDWPLGENPTSGIEKFGKQREFLPWPEWMVAKVQDAPEAVQIAVELMLGTGQRPAAAIAMTWADFTGDSMFVTDDKSDDRWEVHCPPRLRSFLEGVPKTGQHILAKNLREPLGYDAIEKRFRRWRSGLGETAKPFTLHGLRKLAIMQLAEAGGTDAQIQAVTGQSAETVAYYRRLASREKLSRQVQEMRD